MNSRLAPRQFVFDWRITLLAATLLPLMISLGFWQLRRAEENRLLLAAAQEKRQQAAVWLDARLLEALLVDLAAGNTAAWQHRPVHFEGKWLPQEFLLENQLHEGRNGYHVIGVMVLSAGGKLLVNRGWVPAPPLRSEMPGYPLAAEVAKETGEVYVASHVLSDGDVFAEQGWPRRIGALHIPALARELQSEVLPFVVRLQAGSPSALTAQWPVVNIAPEKNIAYAVQWFAMSAALVVCYLAFGFRRTVPVEVN